MRDNCQLRRDIAAVKEASDDFEKSWKNFQEALSEWHKFVKEIVEERLEDSLRELMTAQGKKIISFGIETVSISYAISKVLSAEDRRQASSLRQRVNQFRRHTYYENDGPGIHQTAVRENGKLINSISQKVSNEFRDEGFLVSKPIQDISGSMYVEISYPLVRHKKSKKPLRPEFQAILDSKEHELKEKEQAWKEDAEAANLYLEEHLDEIILKMPREAISLIKDHGTAHLNILAHLAATARKSGFPNFYHPKIKDSIKKKALDKARELAHQFQKQGLEARVIYHTLVISTKTIAGY